MRLFVNPELIKWSGLCEIYEKDLRSTEVFSSSTEEGCKRWADLRNRVVEHVRESLYGTRNIFKALIYTIEKSIYFNTYLKKRNLYNILFLTIFLF